MMLHKKASLVQREVDREARRRDCKSNVLSPNNPSVTFGASSPYTGEPFLFHAFVQIFLSEAASFIFYQMLITPKAPRIDDARIATKQMGAI